MNELTKKILGNVIGTTSHKNVVSPDSIISASDNTKHQSSVVVEKYVVEIRRYPNGKCFPRIYGIGGKRLDRKKKKDKPKPQPKQVTVKSQIKQTNKQEVLF